MQIRSFIAWRSAESRTGSFDRARSGTGAADWREWRDGPLQLVYVGRDAATGAAPALGLPDLILGDDSELHGGASDRCVASGVPIKYDSPRRELVLYSSLVGLPPLFVYRGATLHAITSDLHLLRHLPGVRLAFDADAVMELGRFGHPVGHRTLFRDATMVPGGTRVRFSDSGIALERAWELPELPRLDWPQFLEAQIAAFSSQMQQLRVTKSFLSLTAGLDTRTVFSTLAAQHHLIPAATMTGPRRSLDARIAARLCRAYGVAHTPVTFEDRFVRGLPGFMETASILSGGLASLDQAPEVFLYDQMGAGYQSRLSGNLGNQVGRGGTEGVSVRAADLGIVGPAFRGLVPRTHWLLDKLDQDERSKLHFILQSEVPFTLMPNFGIGNNFAAQQSPYASRALIETLSLRPPSESGPSGSKLHMRLRDLRHRFLGEPASRSFQRTLVRRLGGFAAECPVNWGWRPAGSVSPVGLVFGVGTLAGMFARATGLDAGALRGPLEWSGIPSLHDFRDSRRWLRQNLRDFTLDTLGSAELKTSGLFDWNVLAPILDAHFDGRADHYQTVTFGLDLGLAYRNFCR